MTSIPVIPEIGAKVVDGAGKVARVLRGEGPRGAARRVVRAAYKRLGVASLEEPLLSTDIADSAGLDLPLPGTLLPGDRPIRVGWVTTPPAAGSGGHTTLLRMVEAAERAGHRCTLFIYDRYGGDIAKQEAVVRQWWPDIRADIRDVHAGISGVDACVARKRA